jgi:hypothetical protein
MAHPINQQRSVIFKSLMKIAESKTKERVILSKPTDKE